MHRDRTTDTVDDRLEAALEDWTHAAQDDLRQRIPSSDVLHNIMTTGVHILATTDAILNHVGEKPVDAGEHASPDCASSSGPPRSPFRQRPPPGDPSPPP